MKYRTFRDHAGRVHRVERSQAEVMACWRYWTGISAVSVAFIVIATIAAGIF